MEFNDEKPSLEGIRHYGVKGMRWGHRKAQNSVPDGQKRVKTTRSERKAQVNEAYQKKINNVIETALKDEKSLIGVGTGFSNIPTVVTGKEFIDYIKKGGVFDRRITDVFATRDSSGNYVQNMNPNQKIKADKYKIVDR